jgi:glycosyltransferase involved in cell wall biosynthesis
MIVWVVEVGEPLPIDGDFPRLMRAGLVAQTLTELGHEVTWWTSAFSHTSKAMRPARDYVINVRDRTYTLTTLHSIGYRRHMSPRRFLDHHVNAFDFQRLANRRPRPDVIMVGMPTVELARAVARFAAARNIPFVVDIRDLWPDVMYDRFPRLIRPIVKVLCWPLRRDATTACRLASAVTGVTDRYVSWGLKLARRPRQVTDKSFSLAYQDGLSADLASAGSEEFWRQFGVADGDIVFSFVGSLTRQFDFDPILEVARDWASYHPEVKFVVAGQGPLHPDLARESRRSSNLVVPGWIDAPKIAWLLQRSAAGLAPYRPTENFLGNVPNKIIEYLSFGCPIVTTLGDGLVGQMISEHGVGKRYVPGNAEDLSVQLSSIVNDEAARADASAAARRLFNSEYRAEQVYSALIENLRSVASTGC